MRLLWDEVRPGAARAAHPPGAPAGPDDPHGGFTGAARQDQRYAARHALTAGLVRLGLVPDLPDTHRRIGLAGPAAVRRICWDGTALRPPLQFSIAHTADQVVVALRRADPPPAGLGVDAETAWDTAARNLHRFGTPAELDALHRACGPVEPLHLWCVKEALAKASGLGFRTPPKRYRLHPAGPPGRLAVEIAGAGPAGHRRPARIRAGTRTATGRPPTAWAVADLPTR